jgi:hypothetical protein
MDKIRKLFPPLDKDLILHLIVSSFAFMLIYIFFKSWKLAILAFLSGILIDLDHFIDYFLIYKTDFNFEKFFNGYQFIESKKVYVFLHGWEWLAIILLIGFLTKEMEPALAMVVGIFGHLAVDQILSFKNVPLFYFLTYRYLKKFDLETLDKDYKKKWHLC